MFNGPLRFRKSRSPGVLLRKGVAAGEKQGTASFTSHVGFGGDLNSLYPGAIPQLGFKQRKENVTIVTLSEDLKAEEEIFLLKMDCQGCEYHALLGAKEYIQSHKVYNIFFEFYSKGLQAAGVEPLQLLELLTIDLGYTCFEMRFGSQPPMSLEAFAASYRYEKTQKDPYGRFTDLLCSRLDLL